ncbi:hypothetical protein P7K49_030043, partial [Saguinus oedipus]
QRKSEDNEERKWLAGRSSTTTAFRLLEVNIHIHYYVNVELTVCFTVEVKVRKADKRSEKEEE